MIDCRIEENFDNEWDRMCEYYNGTNYRCNKRCPLCFDINNLCCLDWIADDKEGAIIQLQNWSDTHPKGETKWLLDT